MSDYTQYITADASDVIHAKPLPLTTPWADDAVTFTEDADVPGQYSGTLDTETEYIVFEGTPAEVGELSGSERKAVELFSVSRMVDPDNAAIAEINDKLPGNTTEQIALIQTPPTPPTAADNASATATALANVHGNGSWETAQISTGQSLEVVSPTTLSENNKINTAAKKGDDYLITSYNGPLISIAIPLTDIDLTDATVNYSAKQGIDLAFDNHQGEVVNPGAEGQKVVVQVTDSQWGNITGDCDQELEIIAGTDTFTFSGLLHIVPRLN